MSRSLTVRLRCSRVGRRGRGDDHRACPALAARERRPPAVARTRCTIAGVAGCRTARARLTQGADRGKTTTLLIAGTTGFGSVAAGDRIRVFKTPAPPPGVVAAHVAPYSFADYDRRVLIASMPITTALAAVLALRLRDRELGEAHAHAH